MFGVYVDIPIGQMRANYQRPSSGYMGKGGLLSMANIIVVIHLCFYVDKFVDIRVFL